MINSPERAHRPIIKEKGKGNTNFVQMSSTGRRSNSKSHEDYGAFTNILRVMMLANAIILIYKE